MKSYGMTSQTKRFALSCVTWFIVYLFSNTAFAAANTNTETDPWYFLYSVNTLDRSIGSYLTQPSSGKVRHTGHRLTSQFPTTAIGHPSGRFLYVASKVIDVIETFEVDATTGRLTLLKEKTVSTGRAPHLFALDPQGRFLYVALRVGGVAVYSIDPQDATLKQVPGSPFAAEARTRTVFAHPNGRFVYASNAHSNSISGYHVNQITGILTPIPGSPFFAGDDTPVVPPDPMRDKPVEAGGMPFSVTVDASGHYLYVANRMGASLSAFRINPETGAISPLKGSPFSTCFDPYTAKAHPSEPFLYVLCYAPDTVTGYRINPENGQLTPVPSVRFKTYGEFPTTIQFEPEGKLAFVANYHTSNISVFNLDLKTGALTFKELIQSRLSPMELAVINKPAIKQRNTTHYLAVASQDTLTLYDMKDGKQQAIMDKKIATANTEKGPSAMVVHPVQPIIYVANKTAGTVSAFRVEPKSKQLTPLPGSPYATGKLPVAIAVDTNGWYLYVVNQGSDNLSVFALNHSDGVPSEIPPSPFPVGKSPGSIAIDAAGRHAYVANTESDALSIFRYWSTVSPIIDNRIRHKVFPKTGKKPVSVAINYTGKFLYVANADSKNLSIYESHPGNGHLRETKASPVHLKGTPVAIATHPERAVIYVVTKDPGVIKVYRRQDLTGAVSEIQTKAISGSEPIQLHIDSSARNLFVVTKTGLMKCPLDPVAGKLISCTVERLDIIPTAISTLP